MCDRDPLVRLHRAVLAKNGRRDDGLLQSALAAPQASFDGEYIMQDMVEIAAAYLFYLCNNHPFIDGNKRVALATCLVFLKTNGVALPPDSPDWKTFVLDVAASRLDRQANTSRLRELLTG